MNALSGGSCNCMYGPQDPRCCIPRAQRKLLEDAWEMGKRGEPLPPVPAPLPLDFSTLISQPAPTNWKEGDPHASK